MAETWERAMSSVVAPPPANMSDLEWQARLELAACYRLFVRFGWTDLIFTHLSVRVPDQSGHYLSNPYGLLFHEITASRLIKVDYDGRVVAGDFPCNPAGHAVHTAVLKTRADVNCVLHSHTRAGMAVSCMKRGLLPLVQQSGEMLNALRYHDYEVATDNEQECRRLGEDLGDGWAMIMRNHGLMSVGRTVAEAFYLHYTLENACKVQVDVLSSGEEFTVPSDSALRDLAAWGDPPPDRPIEMGEIAWPALLRWLDETQPDYKR